MHQLRDLRAEAIGRLAIRQAEWECQHAHETRGEAVRVIREHTVEGYFCDPVYGGNRGAVGWRLVGFPGAQWGYTAQQMKPGFDATVIPIKTLSDLRRELKNLPDNAQYYTNEGK